VISVFLQQEKNKNILKILEEKKRIENKQEFLLFVT
jgi:hypothetical protein